MPNAIVILADGCEEMEAVIVIDILRRAGWRVRTMAVGAATVAASRGVKLIADATWETPDPAEWNAIVLPGGGPGTQALRADARVIDAVRRFAAAGRTVAAICAAPLVLQDAGLLDGRRATCHPAVAAELKSAAADRVVVDGRLITSRAPGTAIEFALTLIREHSGKPAADAVAAGLVLFPGQWT